MNANFEIYRSEYKLAEVNGDKVFFFDPILENRMKLLGIPIPALSQSQFGQKQYVTYRDFLFTKAFVEIYYSNYLVRQGCKKIDKIAEISQNKLNTNSTTF